MRLTMPIFRECTSVARIDPARILALCVLGIALLYPPPGSSEQIYRWIDSAGQVHFTDEPPPDRQVEQVQPQQPENLEGVTLQPAPGAVIAVQVNREVVMYSAPQCAVCEEARDYFRKQGIPFKEYNVETSVKGFQDYADLEGRGVPIILVGNRRMNGFSVEAFERLYPRLDQTSPPTP